MPPTCASWQQADGICKHQQLKIALITFLFHTAVVRSPSTTSKIFPSTTLMGPACSCPKKLQHARYGLPICVKVLPNRGDSFFRCCPFPDVFGFLLQPDKNCANFEDPVQGSCSSCVKPIEFHTDVVRFLDLFQLIESITCAHVAAVSVLAARPVTVIIFDSCVCIV